MRYFEERIRTIAAFKMNGYSPYMEHVFVSPTDPLPAPLDGITPAQLRALTAYAARFHVALIPEQQTFAHMHNTLRLERYAAAAELPHGFLLAPNVALSAEYLSRIVGQELAAVGRPPFFHIGSDETATLGLGQTQAYVAARGRSQAYADHIVAMNRLIEPSGARMMLWDDGIEADPGIMQLIPRSAVIVNWHYGAERSFEPYIRTIAGGGFEQMVAPGASNWNEIFPNVESRDRKRAYASSMKERPRACSASFRPCGTTTARRSTRRPGIRCSTPPRRRGRTATSCRRSSRAIFRALSSASTTRASAETSTSSAMRWCSSNRRTTPPRAQTDALFWSGVFDPGAAAQVAAVDLRLLRLRAESVEHDRYFERPPLHANAASVMFLAARRYDALGAQAPNRHRKCARCTPTRSRTRRATTRRRSATCCWCQYWMWELRDAYEDLAPLYARAWRYESRDGHLASNLERYHLAAQKAIELSDAFSRASLQYARMKTLPPFPVSPLPVSP